MLFRVRSRKPYGRGIEAGLGRVLPSCSPKALVEQKSLAGGFLQFVQYAARWRGNTFSRFSVSRPASKLLGYAGTDSVADAFPAATQLERPLLRDQLEAAIQGLLEPFFSCGSASRIAGNPCFSTLGSVKRRSMTTQEACRITDIQAS